MNKFIFLTICILSFGLQLHAEEVDTLNSRSIFLDEVVVQSFKQNKSYRMEPISASAFSSTGIVNRNITGIKEFSALVPNLFIPDYGSKLTSPVYIRGIGSKINAPSVGLYVDGIPYFEKSAFDFDFSEIDRIEVLRGPQGTLYGRNTMGGIINVFTKSPLEWQGSSLS
jgi:Outer membrane receptor for ferrienterochelin and colicins